MEQQRPKNLTLLNNPTEPLTEQEIVAATVAYANGATLTIRRHSTKAESIVRDAYVAEMIATSNQHRTSKPNGERNGPLNFVPPATVTTEREFYGELRSIVRSTLSAWVKDPVAGARSLIENAPSVLIEYRAWEIAGNTVLRKTPTGFRLGTHYNFESPVQLIEFGLLLLLDEGREFAGNLCQCHYQPCGLFFFEKQGETGRPQRIYCCEDHIELGHNAKGKERMAALRAKRMAESKRRIKR